VHVIYYKLKVRYVYSLKPDRHKTHTPAHTNTDSLSTGHCTELANDRCVQYIARFALFNVQLIDKPMNIFTTDRRPEQHLYNTVARIRQ